MTSALSNTLGIIPARIGSTRFPGKPLALLCGKPLIQRTYEQAKKCQTIQTLVIATDDEEIATVAKSFGAEVVMTATDHPTGTDRIAEAVAKYPDAQQIVNIQGDEPLIEPELIDQLVQKLVESPAIDIVTAANEFTDEDPNNPNFVKVVLNQQSEALYFSRSCIPFRRVHSDTLPNFRHKGIYGFQRHALERFVTLDPSPLETSEQLEQLRALENGMKIHVIITDDTSIGLDTPDQIPFIEAQLKILN